MTVSELRTLVDNLDEYIHIPGGIDRLKKMVLHLAVSGQLVPQDPSEGTGEELYQQIQAEKAELVEQGEIRKGKILPEISEDEIPFEIPRSWRWTRVSDLGYSLGQKVPDEDFYYVDVASIDNESQHLKQPSILTAKDAPSRARKMVKKGTVIYSTVRPYLLNTTIIENEFDKELIASTAFAILHPFVGVDPWWLLRNLTSNYFTDYTNRKSVGMAYPAINDAQFSMAIMPLPPLAEQERIVAKVDSLFVLIDQLAEVYKSEQTERSKLVASSLAKLAKAENDAEDNLALTHLSEIIRTKADAKVLRQTILHLAVSGRLVPQDLSEGTGEDLYKQIRAVKAKTVTKRQKPLPDINTDDVPFKIPPSWKWVHVGDVFRIRGGKRLPAGQKLSRTVSDHVYIRVTDMSNGTVDTSNLHYVDNKSAEEIGRYIITSDDLYLSIAGSIGKVGKIPQELSGSNLTENASRLTPYSNDADLDFYLTVIASSFVQDQFQDKKVQMAQPKLALFRIENSLIPLPPLAEQKRIVTKTTQLLNLVTELEKHLEK